MANGTPIDPHVVALDTEVLRAGAWPNVNAKLRQFAELVLLFGPNLWIPEGALAEVAHHAERDIRDANDRFQKAQSSALRRGLLANATTTDVERALSEWERRQQETLASLRIRVIPHTTRTSDQFFRMAVDRVPPFTDDGVGFRDAVIFFSVVDEMTRMGLALAILVSGDKDFHDCKSPVAGQNIVVMNLDTALDNFKALRRVRKDALVEALFEQAMARTVRAVEAVTTAAPVIEKFVRDFLEVGSSDVPDLPGSLVKPLAYRFTRVRSLFLSPIEDVNIGTVVKASGPIEFEGEFEIVPTDEAETRLRLGEHVRDRPSRRALANAISDFLGDEPPTTVVTAPFVVGLDLQMTRHADGYADVIPERVWHINGEQHAALEGLLRATDTD